MRIQSEYHQCTRARARARERERDEESEDQTKSININCIHFFASEEEISQEFRRSCLLPLSDTLNQDQLIAPNYPRSFFNFFSSELNFHFNEHKSHMHDRYLVAYKLIPITRASFLPLISFPSSFIVL